MEMLLQQGRDQLDRGEYGVALETFQQAIELEPQNPEALYGCGLACYRLEQYQESVDYFDKAIEFQPDYHEAWFNRGDSLDELGQFEEAIASYDKAIEFQPDYHEAWFNRGDSLDELGQFEEAIASYDKAIEFQPDYHEAWFNRGDALDDLGQFKEEIASYDKAIEFQPDYHEAWFNRGNALYNLGQFEEAISSYNKAIEFKPDKHEAWNARGAVLCDRLQRFEEAIASYDKAIEFKPDLHEAWYNRGITLDNLGQFEEAIASYDKAIKFKPDDHVAWYNRGIALRNLGQFEEAIASYDKAIEFKPDYHEAWSNRGNVLYNLGQFEEAIASYDKAIEIKPDLHEAWFNRGNALYNLGRYEEAIASYDKAIEFKPDDREAWSSWHQLVQKQPNPFPYWLKMKESCFKALAWLTFAEFPQRHLEVLQYLLKICNYLGDNQTINEQLEKGRQQLDELQKKCDNERQKISLEHKYAAFEQLQVDIRAQSSDKRQQIAALEIAEKRKNTCLGWLRQGWGYNASSPNYQQMQKLLNPQTAAIYWHVSPAAITTFILKYNQDPQVHQPPTPELRGNKPKTWEFWREQPKPYPASAYQRDKFEEWFKEWKSDYQTYRQSTADKTQLPWRKLLRSRLQKLGDILDIQQIQTQLRDVNRLILIPHGDLHLLPLHYLFSRRFTITYLPSAQIGLNLSPATSVASILNVEPGGDLLFTIIEAVSISWLYPQYQQLESSAITKEQIIQALQTNRDTFHFTGHGYHDIEKPENSALVLAHPDKLTMEDIFSSQNNLDFNGYSLICLSACETGITSKQNQIDEYVGLVAAFLAKGASCAVSTLWNVDERSTALLMIRFYQLLKNTTPTVALKEAQDWLRNLSYPMLAEWYLDLAKNLVESDRQCSAFLEDRANIIQNDADKMKGFETPFADPYHWAGFILTGRLL